MIPSEYEDLLIIQYADKPKAAATVALLVNQYKKVFDLLESFDINFDLDSAIGKQLDIIGKIVGISRNIEGVIPKIFFGFSLNPNARSFGNASFYTLDQEKYSSTQLSDPDYRFFIRMKIAKNHAKVTMADNDNRNLNSVILAMFDGYSYVVDNKDMTTTIYIENSPKAYLLPYLKSLNLIPSPQGVGIKYISLVNRITFGFSNNPNAKSFGNGAFARILQGV